MTLSIATLSIRTSKITKLSIKTVGKGKQHKNAQNNGNQYKSKKMALSTTQMYVYCDLAIMLSVILPFTVMLNVVAPFFPLPFSLPLFFFHVCFLNPLVSLTFFFAHFFYYFFIHLSFYHHPYFPVSSYWR